ncbi:uncharacterized protein [Asterias amurensis]|uniref:uncharacterized protein n=1 Tax=Asterias amurensis TaxID=7602 RepID=UPI003AB4530B
MYFDPIPYKDSNGHYVIDGDGPIFRHVLNFLRRSSLCLPHDFKEWDLVSAEAEFYMIRELMDAVKSLKEKRSREGSRQEREFIEMSFFDNESKEVTSYRGTAVTLTAIPTLWSYFKSDDPPNAPAIIDYVNANGSYSACSDKGVDRMKIYQEMTRLCFKLLNTSIRESSQVQVTLFGPAMSDLVTLNVGGSLYTTTVSTLTCYPNSMLGTMFSGNIPTHRDNNGHYIIDGDGPIFRHVLNFLRRYSLCLPHDFKEWDLLSAEADFFQIDELKHAVKTLKGTRCLGSVELVFEKRL